MRAVKARHFEVRTRGIQLLNSDHYLSHAISKSICVSVGFQHDRRQELVVGDACGIWPQHFVDVSHLAILRLRRSLGSRNPKQSPVWRNPFRVNDGPSEIRILIFIDSSKWPPRLLGHPESNVALPIDSRGREHHVCLKTLVIDDLTVPRARRL
jgi:hypothetical protein